MVIITRYKYVDKTVEKEIVYNNNKNNLEKKSDVQINISIYTHKLGVKLRKSTPLESA